MSKTYKMRPLRYNSTLWISGVADQMDVNSTNRITEDIDALCAKSDLYFDFHMVKTPEQPFSLMDAVAFLCDTKGYRPIIHLDFHGSEIDGLALSHSKQFVSWGDLFAKLRAINIILENDLFVVAVMMIGAVVAIFAGRQWIGGASDFWIGGIVFGLLLFLKFFTVFISMSKALRATEAVARKHDLI